MEDDERHSQPYFQEYDLLGPDITQNTQGRHILIFPVVLSTPVLLESRSCQIIVPDPGSHYQPSAWRLTQSIYDRTFSASVQHMMLNRTKSI